MFGNQTLLCQMVLPVRSCAAAIRPDRRGLGGRGAASVFSIFIIPLLYIIAERLRGRL